jgi:hypothetical protein
MLWHVLPCLAGPASASAEQAKSSALWAIPFMAWKPVEVAMMPSVRTAREAAATVQHALELST